MQSVDVAGAAREGGVAGEAFVEECLTTWGRSCPKPTREIPRLCRGGSRSLTFTGVGQDFSRGGVAHIPRE